MLLRRRVLRRLSAADVAVVAVVDAVVAVALAHRRQQWRRQARPSMAMPLPKSRRQPRRRLESALAKRQCRQQLPFQTAARVRANNNKDNDDDNDDESDITEELAFDDANNNDADDDDDDDDHRGKKKSSNNKVVSNNRYLSFKVGNYEHVGVCAIYKLA
jgi:hypothetical protein